MKGKEGKEDRADSTMISKYLNVQPWGAGEGEFYQHK